ncbi:hypothetical protein B0H10DRAFT_1962790 [Mycena sp. CBHHK59/15]|nr:hypothetical protein B0H10DRAFT_1962790 [Mycena sp. CBHHK59/15]
MLIFGIRLKICFPAQSQSDFLACPWTKCAADPKYDDFKDALEQALEKVDEYYHKALARRSPGRPSDRYGNVQSMVSQDSSPTARRPAHPSPQKKKKETVKMRRSIVLEDEEDDSGTTESHGDSHPDPLKPWFDEYQLCFNVHEVVPEGIDTIQ